MTHIMSSLKTRLTKRAAYHRTVREIRAMSQGVARDLNMDPDNAEQIAARAIYGL